MTQAQTLVSSLIDSNKKMALAADKILILVKFKEFNMFIYGSSDASILNEVNCNLEKLGGRALPSNAQILSRSTARFLRKEASFAEVILNTE